MKVKEHLFTEPEHDRELYEMTDMDLPHDIDQMSVSRFYKAADLPEPILVTIKHIGLEDIAQDGKEPDNVWVMSFFEVQKTLVVKAENQTLISHALGTRDPHQWLNQKIVLFNDPTVRFGTRVMGGVRCRAPKSDTSNVPEDDIPY